MDESSYGWFNDWLLAPRLDLTRTRLRLNSNGHGPPVAPWDGEPWRCADLWIADPAAGAINMSLSDHYVYGKGADMATHLVSLVNIGGRRGVLACIKRIIDVRETPPDLVDPVTGRLAAPEFPYQYVFEDTDLLEHIWWRQVIDWGLSRNPVQHAHTQNKRVLVVHDTSIRPQLLAALHTGAA